MLLMILSLLVGVVGACLLSFGAWLIYQPLGFVIAGLECLAWSWLVAHSLARQSGHRSKEGE